MCDVRTLSARPEQIDLRRGYSCTCTVFYKFEHDALRHPWTSTCLAGTPLPLCVLRPLQVAVVTYVYKYINRSSLTPRRNSSAPTRPQHKTRQHDDLLLLLLRSSYHLPDHLQRAACTARSRTRRAACAPGSARSSSPGSTRSGFGLRLFACARESEEITGGGGLSKGVGGGV